MEGRGDGKWVRVEYPSAFRLTLDQLAALAGWRLRRDRATGAALVCTEERYRGTRARLLRATKVADTRTAADPGAYELFRQWESQDRFTDVVDEPTRRRIDRMPIDSEEAFWVHARILSMVIPDSDWPSFLQRILEDVLAKRSGASLWGSGRTLG